MKRAEIKYVAGLLKKVTALLTGTENRRMGMFQASANESYRGGICRTPADSAILRGNGRP